MKEKKEKASWFWNWFLNNQVVTALLIVLLVLLILIAFTKISYLFTPVWQFLTVVGIPIIVAAVFYYFLVPIVDFMERHKIKRVWGILILFVIIVGLIAWGAIVAVPKIQEQLTSFITNFPSYVDTLSNQIEKFMSNSKIAEFQPQIDKVVNDTMDSLSTIIQNFSKGTIQSIGNIVGAVANTFLVILTAPFILFYLLKDGKKLPGYIVKFLPNRFRPITLQVMKEMNTKVSQYIRGQLTVAFTVAVMFIIGFSAIGLDFAVTLGVVAGFLNLIPYLGSFLAMIPAVFLALVAGPMMVLKVAIVFVIEQTIEGRVVSPLVLGSQLNVHPVTIIFILLTSGKIWGVAGVVLGIPVYAALKVLITYLFEWYKKVSSLYDEGKKEKLLTEPPEDPVDKSPEDK